MRINMYNKYGKYTFISAAKCNIYWILHNIFKVSIFALAEYFNHSFDAMAEKTLCSYDDLKRNYDYIK